MCLSPKETGHSAKSSITKLKPFPIPWILRRRGRAPGCLLWQLCLAKPDRHRDPLHIQRRSTALYMDEPPWPQTPIPMAPPGGSTAAIPPAEPALKSPSAGRYHFPALERRCSPPVGKERLCSPFEKQQDHFPGHRLRLGFCSSAHGRCAASTMPD